MAVQGGPASVADIERRVAPSVQRVEPRQRAIAYLPGRLSPAARQHRWPLAAVRGDTTPYGLPPWRRRARWDAEAVRDAVQCDLAEHLSDAEAVLVVDATGLRHKGRHAAGVARP